MDDSTPEAVAWTLAKYGSFVLGVLGTAVALVNGWFSRKTSREQLERQSTEQRVTDLERKYDDANERYNRRVEELRGLADRQREYFERRLEEYMQVRERLLGDIRQLESDKLELKRKLAEAEQALTRFHTGG